MSDILIETAKKKVLEVFDFLNTKGFNLIKFESKDDSSFEFTFLNEHVKKEVSIRILNYNDVKRFFLAISITIQPYKTVDDFISFSEYLEKNKIVEPGTLEKDGRTVEAIEKYIESYCTVFKQEGMELISTSKQFPGYYPKWN